MDRVENSEMKSIQRKKSGKYCSAVFVLILVCMLLLLHEPLFVWWCDTCVGKFLNGIEPSCFIDAVSFLLIVSRCGAVIEIPDFLSAIGKPFPKEIPESNRMMKKTAKLNL